MFRRSPRLRRAFGRILLTLALLAIAGFLYQRAATSREARRFPPPGSMVDVGGGRRLHVICLGAESPTVLFEPSSFSNSTSFRKVREELAKQVRVCSYDRAGTGWSDRGPDELPLSLLADDVDALRRTASPESPFIIVASSIGGLTAEMFARRRPEAVAGMVYADASNSAMIPIVMERIGTMGDASVKAGCLAVWAAGTLGVIRLLDPFGLRAADADAQSAAIMYGRQPWNTLCAMTRAMRADLTDFASAPPLRPDLPLAVLTATTSDDVLPPGLERLVGGREQRDALIARLRETHRHFAARSTRGSWTLVEGSGHLIAVSRPQEVIDAVRQVLNRR